MKEQIGLEISKDVWKFFIKAHPDCDTDAFVDEIVAGCEAECQARVERIFKEIEENMDGLCVYTEEYGEMHCCIVNPEKIKPAKLIFDTKVWQAIKKEYLNG